jgi:hypothetical protein
LIHCSWDIRSPAAFPADAVIPGRSEDFGRPVQEGNRDVSFRQYPRVSAATALVRALNVAAKAPQFSYLKARATARQDANVDWAKTKAHNDDFNADVDGCESFVMNDGSIAQWATGKQQYLAR